MNERLEIEAKREAENERKQAKYFVKEMAGKLECCVCSELLYQPVNAQPCLHTFCGGCLSEWFSRHKDCPECGNPATSVSRAISVEGIVQMLIEKDPGLKRSHKTLHKLD